MTQPTPIELHTSQLKVYETALHKSFLALREGREGMTKEKHEIHKKNLEPLIFKYVTGNSIT
jgi:hypothetical protein